MQRKATVIIWLTFLSGLVITLFWRSEWIYNLPTPIPANYTAVLPGQTINLSKKINSGHTKPLFLHFFNPDCPCSRFNVAHFKALVKEYHNKANFAIVVLSSEHYTVKEISSRFNIDLPVFFDSSIAATCGVYATPQAAIIDTNHTLYYRGNYNRSRYCTDKKTEYAKAALDALLNKVDVVFDPSAVKSYGCQLPKCTK